MNTCFTSKPAREQHSHSQPNRYNRNGRADAEPLERGLSLAVRHAACAHISDGFVDAVLAVLVLVYGSFLEVL